MKVISKLASESLGEPRSYSSYMLWGQLATNYSRYNPITKALPHQLHCQHTSIKNTFICCKPPFSLQNVILWAYVCFVLITYKRRWQASELICDKCQFLAPTCGPCSISKTYANVRLKHMYFRVMLANVLLIERSPGNNFLQQLGCI